MPTLATSHRALWQLAHGRGDGAGLVRAGRGRTPAAAAAIYGEMYRTRTTAALAADFPACAGLLGGPAFAALVADYVASHPSRSPDIGRLGDRLAAYLLVRPPSRARPDLAALAALEWARAELAQVGPVPAPATVAALTALPPTAQGQARLAVADGVTVLALPHDPTPLWRALRAALPVPTAVLGPAVVVVFTHAQGVVHRALPAEEGVAMQLAVANRPLAEICGAFADAPEPAQAAFACIGSWFDDGLIGAVQP